MKRLILALLMIPLWVSCIPQTPVDNDPKANFEALWSIINERYCYLEEKDVDWDSVHDRYSKLIDSGKYNDNFALFYLMNRMLNELKDGHVNLISSFDIGRYDAWDDDTKGLNVYARRKYLGPNPLISGGMRYNVLQLKDKTTIGYVVYSSFSNSLGDMNFILKLFENCSAIILDVRGNGGGLATGAEKLVSYFIDERKLVGYTTYKLSAQRNHFSDPKPLYVTPNEGPRWTKKPLIILQDQGCYSSCNDFLSKIRVAPNAITIGLRSGGGGGMPASSELPNGWRVRYSAVKSLDFNKKSIEEGIDPTIKQSLPGYDVDPGADDLIFLRAIHYIISNSNKESKS